MILRTMILVVICFVNIMCKPKCGKVWVVNTNFIENEIVLEDTLCDNNLLILAEGINLEKRILDSAINVSQATFRSSAFSLQEIAFRGVAVENALFNGKNVKVYKLYWIMENTPYNDFSSFILYTEEYGIVFRFYRKSGKEFFKARLKEMHGINEVRQMDAFTNDLMRNTNLIEAPPVKPGK
jgi:hypothetical protein